MGEEGESVRISVSFYARCMEIGKKISATPHGMSRTAAARRGARGPIACFCRLVILAVAIELGCSNEDDAPSPPPAESRIVSLSPLATRFLLELGVSSRLVAVDTGSLALLGTTPRPVTSLAAAHRFDADLVLVPALPDDVRSLADLADAGARVVEFAPHDLEDVFILVRGVAGPLVGEEAATAFERRIARPLALIAGQSPSEGRPRVIALVNVDPPEIAGGHSFETDLIEIAGGSSVTHGGDDNRRPIDAAELVRLAPDRVVVMTASALDARDQDRALRLVGAIASVDFFTFDRESFWLAEPAEDAARLRAIFSRWVRSQLPPKASAA